ncbi:hypothetical protein AX15_004371 [Amanita polypyramis BW_CC]|nr:hypothetical protein AX15_004371 [Amanita polypyramis BW_CC]
MDFVTCLTCWHRAAASAIPGVHEEGDGKVVRSGIVRVKKQGLFAGWRTKWVVLQGETLTFYSSESSTLCSKEGVIRLQDVQRIERVDAKPFCLLLEANNRRYWLSLQNDVELYDWQDDVYLRTPRGEGSPFDFKHDVHVGVDPDTGGFTMLGDVGPGLVEQLGKRVGVM